jgi:hypothetical protein
MDVRTYVQQQLANAHRQVDEVMKDITEDQFNWLPPGLLNPISAIYIHVVAGEDFFIQAILQGKTRCWESQGWGAKIGIQLPPQPGHNWDECRCTRLAVAPVLEYQKCIRSSSDAYLAGLTPEELDRRVDFVGRIVPVADILNTLVDHIASHTGEMAALKGMQGVKGLPF